MRLLRRINLGKSRCIGIIGAGHGSGVTHTALALANYCHSCLGENVSYIEVTEKSRLLNIVCHREISVGNHLGFKYKGVKYFVSCSQKEARDLIRTLKGTVIVDIEEFNENTASVFSLCKSKIILGSFKPWKQDEVIYFINKEIQKIYDTKNILFLGINITNKEKKEFKKNFDCIVFERPEIINPMSIKEREFKKLDKILDV